MILTRNMSSGKSPNCDRQPASKIEAQISTFHMVVRKLIISEQIIGLFYELSRQSNSFILRSSLRPLSRRVASPGGSSRCSPVPHIAGRSPNQLSNVNIPQTDAILVRPGGRRPAGSGGSGSGRSPETRPDSTTQSGNEPHRSRGRRSDSDFCPSHQDDGNRRLNEELAVTRCLMSKEKSAVMRHQTYKAE
jgi:hypothetical protein